MEMTNEDYCDTIAEEEMVFSSGPLVNSLLCRLVALKTSYICVLHYKHSTG